LDARRVSLAQNVVPCVLCVTGLCGDRDECHRLSSKQDRDAVKGERGSKTEGKGRIWLSGHR